jgi:hypothetical protein
MTGRRIINENTAALFEQALIQTPVFPTSGDSVNDLLELFNTKVESIMNNVAPLKLKSITSKKKAPWLNSPTVKLMRRECRKSERKWRKNKLQVNLQIHNENLPKYNFEVCKARQSYFSD